MFLIYLRRVHIEQFEVAKQVALAEDGEEQWKQLLWI